MAISSIKFSTGFDRLRYFNVDIMLLFGAFNKCAIFSHLGLTSFFSIYEATQSLAFDWKSKSMQKVAR